MAGASIGAPVAVTLAPMRDRARAVATTPAAAPSSRSMMRSGVRSTPERILPAMPAPIAVPPSTRTRASPTTTSERHSG